MKNILTILLTFSVLCMFAQYKPVALNVGDKAPDFKAKDHKGNMISLKKLTKTGKVVVMFYRGAWCPYCNKYMGQLEEALPQFKAKNATVIAITPETDESIVEAIEKTKASFSVIYDKDRSIMKNWKVAYTVSTDIQANYKGRGRDLEKLQGDWLLPVPATYIVGKNGKIEFVHFDENFRERAEISAILKVL